MNSVHISRFSGGGALLIGILIWTLASGQATAMEAGQGLSSGIRFGAGIDITGTAAGAQSVAAADLDGDGDMDVISASTNDGELRWYRNLGGLTPNPTPIFVDRLGGAYTVLPADLNGDGAVDIVATGVGSADEGPKLVWYRNDGGADPTFTRYHISDALHVPASTDATDLDRDGDIDLVLVDRANHALWQYENLGGDAPSFTTTLISGGLDGAAAVKSGDLNRDGNQDVVVAAENSDTIIWFKNNGARPASFAPYIIRTASAPSPSPDNDYARTVDLADVDGDGKLDVIYGSDEDGELGWYENNGDAHPTFLLHVFRTGMGAVESVAAADMDHDGDIDVVAGGGDDLLFFENDGGSTPAFFEQPLSPTADGFRSVAVADFNSDGQRDLLSASEKDNRITWYPNQMPHRSAYYSAQTRSVIVTRTSSRMAHTGDLDHDGDVDMVSISEREVLWHENDGQTPPSFETHLIESGIDRGRWVHVADLDSDGDLDVVSAVPSTNRVAWHENIGGTPPQFSLHVITNNAIGARSALAGDLDGDGDMDVFSASHGDNKIAWYENDGGRPPNFQEHVVTLAAAYARSVYAADLNGDGNLDLLSASQQDDKVNWYQNDGNSPPTFTSYTIGLADGAQHVEAADMDSDGDIDVIVASEFDNMVAWYENTGDALPQFVHHPVDGAASAVHAVHADDFDGDGDLDLVAAIEALNAIKWYENNGQMPPQFTSHLVYDRALTAHGIHSDDVDGDGDSDIIGISRADGVVAWFENRGGNYAVKLIPAQSPAPSGQINELAKISFTHRGRAGDANVQLNVLEFQFLDRSGAPVDGDTFSQAVKAAYIYRDTWNGLFDPNEDEVLVWLDPHLDENGHLIAPMPSDAGAAQIGVDQVQTYFLAVEPTSACAATPTRLEPTILLSPQLARDSRHLMPLLAETLPSLAGNGSAGEEEPRYLFINELMANNVQAVADPDEPTEFPDWLEIYNDAPFVIDLSGMYLTDDLSIPTKYRIPDGVTVPQRGHLLFIADNETTQGPLHTNFRLSSQGESLAIFDTTERGNQIIDAVTFGAQPVDTAYGRFPNGEATWITLGTATPGTVNIPMLTAAQNFFPHMANYSSSETVCP